MKVLASILLFFLTLGFSRGQTCDESTENAFEIDFTITRQEFESLGNFTWRVQLASDRETKDGELRYEEYKAFDQVAASTQCIPKDECLVLQVTELLPEQYIIRVDGQVITPGPTFPRITPNNTFTTTEIGNCLPTCADGEALLHVAGYTASSYLDWRLEDVGSGQVLAECDPRNGKDCSWSQWQLYHTRRCLPVDGCYRLIAGDMWWGPSPGQADLPKFDITFNGESVASVEGFRFEAVEFGDQCSASCQENQSLLEMFFWRTVLYDTYPDVSWSFSDGESSLIEGGSTWNDTALQYVRECVPSNACLTFNATVPETYEVEEEDEFTVLYHESNPYRLAMDGVIYVEGHCEFGSFDNDMEEFSETTFVGECDAADVCDIDMDSLLDIQLETGKDAYGSVDWRVDYADIDEPGLFPVFEAWDLYDGFFPNASYRTYLCLPREECLEFTMITSDVKNEEIIKYAISYDDAVLEERDCGDSACLGDTLTYLGGDGCPTSSPTSTPEEDNPETGPTSSPTSSPEEDNPETGPTSSPTTSPTSRPTDSRGSGPTTPEADPKVNPVSTDNTFSTGAMAGVIVGSIIGLVLGSVLIAWIRRKLYYEKEPITAPTEGGAPSDEDTRDIG